MNKNQERYLEYVDSGICPNCGESLKRVWDHETHECVEIKCTDCNWSDLWEDNK